MQCRFATRYVRPSRLRAGPPGRPAAPSPTQADRRSRGRADAPRAARKRRGFSVEPLVREDAQRGRDEDRVSLSRERRAEQSVVERGQTTPDRRRRRERPDARPRGDVAGGEDGRAPRPAPPARRGRRDRRRSQGGSSRRGTPARCGGSALPWKRFQVRTSTRLRYFRCASCSPILPPSRPGTTTSSPRRSRGRARTSSS